MHADIVDSAVRLPAKQGRIEADTWLCLAEQWGISHSVAAPADEFVTVYNDEGNDRMAELVAQHSKKLSGLAVANPWYGVKAVDFLRKAFECDLCGLYLHPGRQGFHLTEAVVDPLIEVCLEYDRPIYSHTGTPVCAMPFQLAELARRFPEASFVMGHMAWSDFSGYDVIPAAQQASNIFLETSCTAGEMVRAAIEVLGEERVLFGTGYPRSLPEYEFEKIRTLNLSQEVLDKYMRENAARLWKINL